MAKLKTPSGRNNACGVNLKRMREKLSLSQHELTELMRMGGFEISDRVVCGIESGTRRMTDIEIVAFAKTLHVNYMEFFRDTT